MNLLITAGPTREAIDPVRYLSESLLRTHGLCLGRGSLGGRT